MSHHVPSHAATQYALSGTQLCEQNSATMTSHVFRTNHFDTAKMTHPCIILAIILM